MDIKPWLDQLLHEGGFGLEEENQRVTGDGRLAATPHPFGDDPHMDRDFCESQLEMITPVAHSAAEVVGILRGYRKRAIALLSSQPVPEYLWPFSNPPYLMSEDDIRIAQFYGDLAEKTAYRHYLAEKYGKRLESLSGIHFNYSYPESFTQNLIREGVYPDQIYLNLAEKILSFSWFIVALTAASPIFDSSFQNPGRIGESDYGIYSSLRCSENGYWNAFDPVLDFNDIDSYISSITQYVAHGCLSSPAELYYPVRLKPAGKNSIEGLRHGINHIELRMLDVNPLFIEGINEQDVEFLAVLIAYLTALPKLDLEPWQQHNAIHNMKQASLYPLESVTIRNRDGSTLPLIEEALMIFDDMVEKVGDLPVIAYERDKILHPAKRYTSLIIDRYKDNFVQEGLRTARAWAQLN